jgi:hypothetical protein
MRCEYKRVLVLLEAANKPRALLPGEENQRPSVSAGITSDQPGYPHQHGSQVEQIQLMQLGMFKRVFDPGKQCTEEIETSEAAKS